MVKAMDIFIFCHIFYFFNYDSDASCFSIDLNFFAVLLNFINLFGEDNLLL